MTWGEEKVKTSVMMDTGANLPLLSISLAKKFGIPVVHRATPWTVKGYGGSSSESWFHAPKITMGYGDHREMLAFEVKETADVDLILPDWWSRRHGLNSSWSTVKVVFDSDYCRAHCLQTQTQPKQVSLQPQ